jgi:hypothetical protein
MESPEEIVDIVHIFVPLKYITGVVPLCSTFACSHCTISKAATFLAVVYDHVITLGEEVTTIWKNRAVRLQSKAAFIINRYLTEAIIAYVVYSESIESSVGA